MVNTGGNREHKAMKHTHLTSVRLERSIHTLMIFAWHARAPVCVCVCVCVCVLFLCVCPGSAREKSSDSTTEKTAIQTHHNTAARVAGR